VWLMRRLPAIAVAVLALGALSGAASVRDAPEQREALHEPVWREIAWPFPRDAWPAGRAVRCDAASCGGAVEIYLRPKIGFCNCDTGVADDDEVDRVADLDLISARFVPKEAGRVVHVADMSGRARDYDLKMPDGTKHAATGIALSHRCDLMIAVVQGEGEAPDLQQMALAYLATDDMRHWMTAALGGR
jgi:hypothetical protein